MSFNNYLQYLRNGFTLNLPTLPTWPYFTTLCNIAAVKRHQNLVTVVLFMCYWRTQLAHREGKDGFNRLFSKGRQALRRACIQPLGRKQHLARHFFLNLLHFAIGGNPQANGRMLKDGALRYRSSFQYILML